MDSYFNIVEIKGFHKRIAGKKASTEEKLVREKERNMFHFIRKNKEFHMGHRTTSHAALFHCR